MLCVDVDVPDVGETGLLAFMPSCRFTGSAGAERRSQSRAREWGEQMTYRSRDVPSLLVQSDVPGDHTVGACLGNR